MMTFANPSASTPSVPGLAGTHSSALACGLARGMDPLDAARFARQIAGEAVRDGLRELGEGAGPVNALGVGRR